MAIDPDHIRPTIIWFRRDLRLNDHAPLLAAEQRGMPVLPLYIYDQLSPEIRPLGSTSRWWLHQSLKALDQSLQKWGLFLCLRQGPSIDILSNIIHTTKAGTLYFHKLTGPGEQELENDVVKLCRQFNIEAKAFDGEYLFSPHSIQTKSETPFKVFTPFWRCCLEQDQPPLPLAAPQHLKPVSKKTFDLTSSEKLLSWQLEPSKPNWAAPIATHWQPGERAAIDLLTQFQQGPIKNYQSARDYPASQGTSRLSPHLHFGEISPRTVWHSLSGQPGSKEFLRQLGWREFCHHLLHHFPYIVDQPFQSEFETFAWQEDKANLRAWKSGNTGYPIIDAAMRQLWQTGWMHNRLRMIVGSFLVKNLNQPWQLGERCFWDRLVDADLANNVCGWQWVAGCGVDAAPYFRIFNPISQSKKFDPEGQFLRRYLPELAALTNAHIHAPHLAPEDILTDAKIKLGQDYPFPMVDLAETRKAALVAYHNMRNQHSIDRD